MEFICNTKPLTDALDLGVVNTNVSNYHNKSRIAQVRATKDTLIINLEANKIKTELRLKGSGTATDSPVVFVNCLNFKQLVNTFDAGTTTLEFAEGGLILHSGKSKFTLPQEIDAGDLELDAPEIPDYTITEVDVDKSEWKFIKDRQMYAIAMSFIHPVYTRVWLGSNSDVLVGDFDNSLFTHSKKSKLGNTCLLSDTIINLFTVLPEGSKIAKMGRDYLIRYSSDNFSYVTQLTPDYETDEGIGSYNADIFIGMMDHPEAYVSVSSSAIQKFLNQADLLASTSDDTIVLSVQPGILKLKDNNVDCQVAVEGSVEPFSVQFKTASLKKVISDYDAETIQIGPMSVEADNDENGNPVYEVAGIMVWDDDLTTIISGLE